MASQEVPGTPHVSNTLPPEVVTCLQNARFLHLATTSPSNHPHISLMNYTYLPSSPYTTSPSIIMTTPPTSTKTANLAHNPLVSLLVHDWVSHRPPTTSQARSTSPDYARRDSSVGGNSSTSRTEGPAGPSSLLSMLLSLNASSLSRISTTINGTAAFVEPGSEAEKYFKALHLESNTFETDLDPEGEGPSGGDGGKRCWVQGEGVRVVVVTIRDGRISDWKGRVRDWIVEETGRPVENGVV